MSIVSKLEVLFDKLWPINRSLTGDGNRLTLEVLKEVIDLQISEIPSGTACFDWVVPPEWNIKEAWIKDHVGNIILDFKDNNLHILGYSQAFEGIVTYSELVKHLYTIPEQPDLIPYRTSYYERRWGFCLSHHQFMALDPHQTYEVKIDATFQKNGHMTIGEAFLKGESEEEILFSTYICHPSMAVNELSGPLVTAFIYQKLKSLPSLRYSYRFLFIPETIGSIFCLSKYGEFWKRQLKGGFVVTCVGHAAPFTYKKSRLGNSIIDQAVEVVLKHGQEPYSLLDFFPGGSDERQYCSPGFNLPVGSLMRKMYGQYPEYHTSGDNKSIMCFESMEKTISVYLEIIQLLERNKRFINKFPHCEPQLGKRGLYPSVSKPKGNNSFIQSMMWLLNYSDGTNDLISIIQKSNLPPNDVYEALEALLASEIICSNEVEEEMLHHHSKN